MKTAIILLINAVILFLRSFVPGAKAAVITVTSTNDSGPGTLRAALASASSNDAISFALSLPANIRLTSGELLVTNSLNIIGPGSADLVVNGNAASRVFHIGPSNVVGISNLTITNGLATGDTFPACCGGGIYNDHAALTLSNCVLSGNSAVASIGGGGAIYNRGANYGSAALVISQSILSGNATSASGGGIYNGGSGGTVTLAINHTTLSGNSAAGGGGIYNDGRANGHATLDISFCSLGSNSTVFGGGGVLNGATFGGSAFVTISYTTISGNWVSGTSSGGGGISNYAEESGSAVVKLRNCTLTANSAGYGGGGIRSFCLNYGTASVEVASTTLSGNSAAVGGGISNDSLTHGSAHLAIGNTILNAGASGENLVSNSGTVTSLGYNLSSDGGGGYLAGAADQINTDPMLGPLQDNGGSTFTHALFAGSPAIDGGTNFTGSATDQRGEARSFDDPNISNAGSSDGSDIGAYETSELRIIAVDRLNNDLCLSFTSVLGRSYELQSRTNLTWDSWGPLPGLTPGNGGVAQTTITNALTQTMRFYRLHQLP